MKTHSAASLVISSTARSWPSRAALLLAAIVIPRGGAGHGKFVGLLEWRPLVGLGIVSYGLFLWHMPLIYWMRSHDLTFRGRSGFAVNVAVTMVVTTAVAALRLFRGGATDALAPPPFGARGRFGGAMTGAETEETPPRTATPSGNSSGRWAFRDTVAIIAITTVAAAIRIPTLRRGRAVWDETVYVPDACLYAAAFMAVAGPYRR